jgi:hypothetical protein
MSDHPGDLKFCALCTSSSTSSRLSDNAGAIECARCGNCEITPQAFDALITTPADKPRYLVSGRTKTTEFLWGSRHRIEYGEVAALNSGGLRDKTFSEKVELAMRWLESQQHTLGQLINVNMGNDYPAAYCHDGSEWMQLVRELGELDYVVTYGDPRITSVRIAAAGWKFLEERTNRGSGSQAFIATSFAPEMQETENALRAGVVAAGYEPMLVRDKEFEDGIVDRIFAEIRRSRFMIADFTHNKAGVYYEAGFGLGLGMRVIGTCEKDHFDPKGKDPLHFDVKHLNMIAWTSGDLADLTTRVERRIRAILGAGPKATAG